jgi:hypothetical protein
MLALMFMQAYIDNTDDDIIKDNIIKNAPKLIGMVVLSVPRSKGVFFLPLLLQEINVQEVKYAE